MAHARAFRTMRDAALSLVARIMRRFPARLALVEGDCLRPVVCDRDIILIRALAEPRIAVGEHVVADVGTTAVVKRIASVSTHHVDLAGSTPYLRVERARLSGRVIAAAPSIRPWLWRRV